MLYFGERCNETVTETIIEIRWLHLSMRSPAREKSNIWLKMSFWQNQNVIKKADTSSGP